MYNLEEIKLNEKIKKYRESRNISITKLGELICKSKSTVSKYENGDVLPDIVTILELCNVLNIELDELFPTQKQDNSTFSFNNLFKESKIFFYYYTENHLVTSIAELVNNKNSNITKVKFYNGVKDTLKYAASSSYYYEGEFIYDKNISYINLNNVNSQGTQYEKIQISFNIPWNKNRDKTFFFILALTPHSIPIVKKGILSFKEIHNIHNYDNYLKITKDELNKIKYNNAWILNDSNYDDIFLNNNIK